MSSTYDWPIGVAHLRRQDPALNRIIDIVGPRKPARLGSAQTPFATLLRSIVYQQLSGKAAGSIHRRVLALFPGGRPSARALLALDDAELRAAGLSRSKVLSVRDLATKAAARQLPSRRALDAMDDEAIIERLTEIRGIGRWTVEMLLIFTLGRPDVLPVTDLGIRRGFMVCRGQRGAAGAGRTARARGGSGAPGGVSRAGTCGGRASFDGGCAVSVRTVRQAKAQCAMPSSSTNDFVVHVHQQVHGGEIVVRVDSGVTHGLGKVLGHEAELVVRDAHALVSIRQADSVDVARAIGRLAHPLGSGTLEAGACRCRRNER